MSHAIRLHELIRSLNRYDRPLCDRGRLDAALAASRRGPDHVQSPERKLFEANRRQREENHSVAGPRRLMYASRGRGFVFRRCVVFHHLPGGHLMHAFMLACSH